MTKYTEITDAKLKSRVCARYSGEITVLKALGFHDLAFKLEARGPFSAVSRLPILPLMRRAKEVLVFPFPLRLALANVLLVHSWPPAIAGCMGLGVKIFTNFSDHSLLISSTLRSHLALQNVDVPEPNLQIIRLPPRLTPQEAWLSHKQRVEEMQARGKTIERTSSFADYVEISRREEEDLRARTA